MADADIDDLEKRVAGAEDWIKGLRDRIDLLTKAHMATEDELNADISALKKQYGDSNKTADKDIADLKARVKELEAKMGKMKK